MWGRNQINIPEPDKVRLYPTLFEQPDVMNVNRVNLVLVTRLWVAQLVHRTRVYVPEETRTCMRLNAGKYGLSCEIIYLLLTAFGI